MVICLSISHFHSIPYIPSDPNLRSPKSFPWLLFFGLTAWSWPVFLPWTLSLLQAFIFPLFHTSGYRGGAHVFLFYCFFNLLLLILVKEQQIKERERDTTDKPTAVALTTFFTTNMNMQLPTSITCLFLLTYSKLKYWSSSVIWLPFTLVSYTFFAM